MLDKIILLSVRYKSLVILLTAGIVFNGLYSLKHIPIGSVPDVTNNQVQILTTSRNLATDQMEQILKSFPEVEQVVSRIGAAEVPTDPMSMEESDVIIKLKPISAWTTAETKDQLAEKFKEALSVIPGIDYEFTQPIEMRFNELITGVRADLAIKIFGEDLDILYKKALEIEKLIQDIDGAADVNVEKIVGLPQMTV